MTPEDVADLPDQRRAGDLMDGHHAQRLDVPALARAAPTSPAHFPRAEVFQEPVSPPWRARDCPCRDASGNLVRIAPA